MQRVYPMYSPYTGMGDSPILIIDLDGKVLYVCGSEESITKLKTILSLSFDSKIEAQVDENGKVTLHIAGNKDEINAEKDKDFINGLSATDKAFFEGLNEIIGSEKNTAVNIYTGEEEGTDAILLGSAGNAEAGIAQGIDLSDMEKLGYKDSKKLTAQGAFIHEAFEQYLMQTQDLGYDAGAHSEATKKELAANGFASCELVATNIAKVEKGKNGDVPTLTNFFKVTTTTGETFGLIVNVKKGQIFNQLKVDVSDLPGEPIKKDGK